MSLHWPPELRWLTFVVGSEWPDGDEDRMFAMGDHWNSAAKELAVLLIELEQVRNQAAGAYFGPGSESVKARFLQLERGPGSIYELSEYWRSVGMSTRNTATSMEQTKLMIIISVVMLAIEIMEAWTSPLTAALQEIIAIGVARAFIQKVAGRFLAFIQSIPWVGNVLAKFLKLVLGDFRTIPPKAGAAGGKAVAGLAGRVRPDVVDFARKLGFSEANSLTIGKKLHEFSEFIFKKGINMVMWGVGQDLLVQGIQMAKGHRDDFAWEEIALTATSNVVGPVVAHWPTNKLQLLGGEWLTKKGFDPTRGWTGAGLGAGVAVVTNNLSGTTGFIVNGLWTGSWDARGLGIGTLGGTVSGVMTGTQRGYIGERGAAPGTKAHFDAIKSDLSNALGESKSRSEPDSSHSGSTSTRPNTTPGNDSVAPATAAAATPKDVHAKKDSVIPTRTGTPPHLSGTIGADGNARPPGESSLIRSRSLRDVATAPGSDHTVRNGVNRTEIPDARGRVRANSAGAALESNGRQVAAVTAARTGSEAPASASAHSRSSSDLDQSPSPGDSNPVHAVIGKQDPPTDVADSAGTEPPGATSSTSHTKVDDEHSEPDTHPSSNAHLDPSARDQSESATSSSAASEVRQSVDTGSGPARQPGAHTETGAQTNHPVDSAVVPPVQGVESPPLPRSMWGQPPEGFRWKSMRDDGDCFFHALYQMRNPGWEGTKAARADVLELRQQLARELRTNPQLYDLFSPGDLDYLREYQRVKGDLGVHHIQDVQPFFEARNIKTLEDFFRSVESEGSADADQFTTTTTHGTAENIRRNLFDQNIASIEQQGVWNVGVGDLFASAAGSLGMSFEIRGEGHPPQRFGNRAPEAVLLLDATANHYSVAVPDGQTRVQTVTEPGADVTKSSTTAAEVRPSVETGSGTARQPKASTETRTAMDVRHEAVETGSGSARQPKASTETRAVMDVRHEAEIADAKKRDAQERAQSARGGPWRPNAHEEGTWARHRTELLDLVQAQVREKQEQYDAARQRRIDLAPVDQPANTTPPVDHSPTDGTVTRPTGRDLEQEIRTADEREQRTASELEKKRAQLESAQESKRSADIRAAKNDVAAATLAHGAALRDSADAHVQHRQQQLSDAQRDLARQEQAEPRSETQWQAARDGVLRAEAELTKATAHAKAAEAELQAAEARVTAERDRSVLVRDRAVWNRADLADGRAAALRAEADAAKAAVTKVDAEIALREAEAAHAVASRLGGDIEVSDLPSLRAAVDSARAYVDLGQAAAKLRWAEITEKQYRTAESHTVAEDARARLKLAEAEWKLARANPDSPNPEGRQDVAQANVVAARAEAVATKAEAIARWSGTTESHHEALERRAEAVQRRAEARLAEARSLDDSAPNRARRTIAEHELRAAKADLEAVRSENSASLATEPSQARILRAEAALHRAEADAAKAAAGVERAKSRAERADGTDAKASLLDRVGAAEAWKQRMDGVEARAREDVVEAKEAKAKAEAEAKATAEAEAKAKAEAEAEAKGETDAKAKAEANTQEAVDATGDAPPAHGSLAHAESNAPSAALISLEKAWDDSVELLVGKKVSIDGPRNLDEQKVGLLTNFEGELNVLKHSDAQVEARYNSRPPGIKKALDDWESAMAEVDRVEREHGDVKTRLDELDTVIRDKKAQLGLAQDVLRQREAEEGAAQRKLQPAEAERDRRIAEAEKFLRPLLRGSGLGNLDDTPPTQRFARLLQNADDRLTAAEEVADSLDEGKRRAEQALAELRSRAAPEGLDEAAWRAAQADRIGEAQAAVDNYTVPIENQRSLVQQRTQYAAMLRQHQQQWNAVADRMTLAGDAIDQLTSELRAAEGSRREANDEVIRREAEWTAAKSAREKMLEAETEVETAKARAELAELSVRNHYGALTDEYLRMNIQLDDQVTALHRVATFEKELVAEWTRVQESFNKITEQRLAQQRPVDQELAKVWADVRAAVGGARKAWDGLATAERNRAMVDVDLRRADNDRAQAETDRTRAEADQARAKAKLSKAEEEEVRKQQAKTDAESRSAEEGLSDKDRAKAEKELSKANADLAAAVKDRAKAAAELARADKNRDRAVADKTRADTVADKALADQAKADEELAAATKNRAEAEAELRVTRDALTKAEKGAVDRLTTAEAALAVAKKELEDAAKQEAARSASDTRTLEDATGPQAATSAPDRRMLEDAVRDRQREVDQLTQDRRHVERVAQQLKLETRFARVEHREAALLRQREEYAERSGLARLRAAVDEMKAKAALADAEKGMRFERTLRDGVDMSGRVRSKKLKLPVYLPNKFTAVLAPDAAFWKHPENYPPPNSPNKPRQQPLSTVGPHLQPGQGSAIPPAPVR